MTFAGINYLAVVVAAAFALVASTAWYTFLNRIVAPFGAPREQTMKTRNAGSWLIVLVVMGAQRVSGARSLSLVGSQSAVA